MLPSEGRQGHDSRWEAQVGGGGRAQSPGEAHGTFHQGHLQHDSAAGLAGAGGSLGVSHQEGAAVLGSAGAGAQGAAQREQRVAARGVGGCQAGPYCEGEQPLFGLLKGKRRHLRVQG